MANTKDVREVYQRVVDDVIDGVREAFLDEGVDEQVLLELKQMWDGKLAQSKALETNVPGLHQTLQQLCQPQQQPVAQHTAPAAHQNRLLTPASQQQPPQLAHQPVPQLQMLQGQMVTLAPHPGNNPQIATISLGPDIYGQSLAQYPLTVPGPQGQNQFVVHAAPGQFLRQTGGQQLSIGQSFALAPTSNVVSAAAKTTNPNNIIQIDGLGDSSSDDDDEPDAADDGSNDEEPANDGNDLSGQEEDPLNSDDDDKDGDSDPSEVFDAENVVVCQFEKITRSKNRWKFHLKDGIMNLNGRDFLFQKANGDAEW